MFHISPWGASPNVLLFPFDTKPILDLRSGETGVNSCQGAENNTAKSTAHQTLLVVISPYRDL